MEANQTTLALLTLRVSKMEHELFGNGQPGIIREFRDALDDLRIYTRDIKTDQSTSALKVENKLKEIKWLVIILVAVTAFVTGSGTISLKEVIAFLH